MHGNGIGSESNKTNFKDFNNLDILEFNHIDEEIAYACESIIEKINEGIGKNNIC